MQPMLLLLHLTMLAVKALQIMVAEMMNVTSVLTNVSTEMVAAAMASPMQLNRPAVLAAVSVLLLYLLQRLAIIAHCKRKRMERKFD